MCHHNSIRRYRIKRDLPNGSRGSWSSSCTSLSKGQQTAGKRPESRRIPSAPLARLHVMYGFSVSDRYTPQAFAAQMPDKPSAVVGAMAAARRPRRRRPWSTTVAVGASRLSGATAINRLLGAIEAHRGSPEGHHHRGHARRRRRLLSTTRVERHWPRRRPLFQVDGTERVPHLEILCCREQPNTPVSSVLCELNYLREPQRGGEPKIDFHTGPCTRWRAAAARREAAPEARVVPSFHRGPASPRSTKDTPRSKKRSPAARRPSAARDGQAVQSRLLAREREDLGRVPVAPRRLADVWRAPEAHWSLTSRNKDARTHSEPCFDVRIPAKIHADNNAVDGRVRPSQRGTP